MSVAGKVIATIGGISVGYMVANPFLREHGIVPTTKWQKIAHKALYATGVAASVYFFHKVDACEWIFESVIRYKYVELAMAASMGYLAATPILKKMKIVPKTKFQTVLHKTVFYTGVASSVNYAYVISGLLLETCKFLLPH